MTTSSSKEIAGAPPVADLLLRRRRPTAPWEATEVHEGGAYLVGRKAGAGDPLPTKWGAVLSVDKGGFTLCVVVILLARYHTFKTPSANQK